MKDSSLDKFASELSSLLERIRNYCSIHTENDPRFGACVANPKYTSVPAPTKEIQAELERRATDHFNKCSAVEQIEYNLIQKTELPEEEKKGLLCQLRKTKQRHSKGHYIAKRPAVSISDIECAQILYLLMQKLFASQANRDAVAEAILFIWIAQHAAFSGLHLKVEDILAIRMTDICFDDLTIQVKDQEINVTGGLSEILKVWTVENKRKSKSRLFQALSYDRLEDVLGRVSISFCGKEWKLQPRDFLARVHVVEGARIPLELRRQIEKQEELVRQSPYRIDPRVIKKNIKASIEKNRVYN